MAISQSHAKHFESHRKKNLRRQKCLSFNEDYTRATFLTVPNVLLVDDEYFECSENVNDNDDTETEVPSISTDVYYEGKKQ